MKMKACAFDLDGTLLDTIPDICAAMNEGLAAAGLPTHTREECRLFVGGGILEAIRRAAPDAPEEKLDKVYAVYKDRYYSRCTEETSVYPGVAELLGELDRCGVALAVLSNKTEATARKIIAHYFPDISFRCVLGRVAGRPLKPDPAAAGPLLDALGVPPRDIAYVGDSGTDMEFARAVGMLPVAAPWGYRAREELIAEGAAFLLHTPDELLALADC